MAFEQDVRWAIEFELPDGRHLATGFTPHSQVKRTVELFFARNAESRPLWQTLKILSPGDTDSVDRWVEDLYRRYPERIGAENMGLDTPDRIMSNPEVVPGSRFAVTF